MTDDREILKYLLTHPDAPVDEAWVRSMELKYPYFSLPALLSMRDSGHADPEQLRRMLLTSGESSPLNTLLDPQSTDDDGFYPPEDAPKAPSTTQTIDTFLATYGGNDPNETSTLEQLIFNPVADYSQKLARETEAPAPTAEPTGNAQDDLINRFLLNKSAESVPDELPATPQPTPAKPKQTRRQPSKKTTTAPAEDTLLSESLAKIYIKARRYDRAYEILSNLSLAFPEKSAYFADQMRFLRMLMLNEEYRRKRENK